MHLCYLGLTFKSEPLSFFFSLIPTLTCAVWKWGSSSAWWRHLFVLRQLTIGASPVLWRGTNNLRASCVGTCQSGWLLATYTMAAEHETAFVCFTEHSIGWQLGDELNVNCRSGAGWRWCESPERLCFRPWSFPGEEYVWSQPSALFPQIGGCIIFFGRSCML